MSRELTNTFNILNINTHLLSILDSEYYIEAGTINLNFIDELLQGQIKKITDYLENDDVYQLDYLYSYHVHSSSCKICLTVGTIKYKDYLGIEKYAPLIIIPVTMNISKNMIYLANPPMINFVFRRFARINNTFPQEVLDYFYGLHNRSYLKVDDIDDVLMELLNIYHVSVSTDSFLTKIDIEYPDIVIPQDVFDHQGSIYEVTDVQIIKDFYSQVTTVLPSNIEQKHIILNAKFGKNFAVDGKLGSGKTSTIINIIADSISNDKKVLYVNQDINSINDFRKKLNALGMHNYICELNNSSNDNQTYERMTIEEKPSFDYNSILELENVASDLNYKYHGYSYSYLIEKLAYMKEKGGNTIIYSSDKLVREEVEFIYNALKKIEYELSFVDPFTNNIWSMLLSSATAPTPDETIERTNYFYDINKKIVNLLKGFTSTFGLVTIPDINDFNHIAAELIAFEKINPLPIWVEPNFRTRASDALDKLNNEIYIYYNSLSWYGEHTTDGYVPGTIKEVLNTIVHNHYSLKDSKDHDYITKLLNEKKEFDSLINEIKGFITESVKTYDSLKEHFNFSEPNKEQFIFLNKLLDTLEKYHIASSWMIQYKDDPKSYLEIEKNINSKVEEIEEVVKEVCDYIDVEDIDIDELTSLISAKNFVKLVKVRIDKKRAKTDHRDIKDIARSIKKYYDLVTELINMLPTNAKIRKFNEIILKNFVGFLHFVNNLTSYESLSFIYFINNSLDKKVSLKECEAQLRKLKELEEKEVKLNERLNDYKLSIKGDNFIETVKQIKSSMPYFERVQNAREQIHAAIKDLEKITTSDVLTLIQVDDAFISNQQEFDDASKEYKELFGDAFTGYDTQVLEIRSTIAYFLKFAKRMKPSKSILQLIDKEKGLFNKLISYNKEFIHNYDEWFSALRGFSTCFFGGKMELQNDSFSQVEKTLNEFIKRFDQVEHVSKIEHILDSFYKYKLDKLAEKIQSGEYYDNLADNFLYSTFLLFYDNLVKEGFKGYNKDYLINKFEAFLENSNNFRCNNIIKIRNGIKYTATSKERKKKKITLTTYNYDKFIKTVPNYQKIYIADAESLNIITDFGYFDLIIIDDAHLSTANKYYKLFEEYHQLSRPFQLIVFGDKSFQSSVTNTLMQRIDKSYFLKLRKRYMLLSSENFNAMTKDNQYIYDNNSKVDVSSYSSMDDFIEKIVQDFETSSHKIGVIVDNDNDKRIFYTGIVKNLLLSYTKDDVVSILDNKIIIVKLGVDNNVRCDNLYVWYNNIITLPIDLKKLYFRNYFPCQKKLYIGYKSTKSIKLADEIKTEINELILHREEMHPYIEGSIVELMHDSLLKAGLTLKLGPGLIDITIITSNDQIGIIVIGKEKDKRYSVIDDLYYYMEEYSKKGWKILLYSIEELYESYDKIIYEIKSLAGE